MARKSSSRSPSPGKTKAKAAAGPVTANTALTATLSWFAIIGFTGLVFPTTLMEGYQIPLPPADKPVTDALVVSMFQSWILWMLMGTGILSIVRRGGETTAEGLCCFSNMIGMAIFLGVGEWKGNATWMDMGMPALCVNFNRGLFTLFIGLNYLGWQASGSPKPDLELLKGGASLGSKYAAAVSLAFGLAMLFDMEGLFKQYNFDPKDKVLKSWITAIFTGMGQTLVMNAVTLVCMLGAEKKTKSDINRWLWAFFVMQIAVSAITGPINKKLLMPDIDMSMQTFNVFLWIAGGTLAWKEMIAK